jgi:hypothetical protein
MFIKGNLRSFFLILYIFVFITRGYTQTISADTSSIIVTSDTASIAILTDTLSITEKIVTIGAVGDIMMGTAFPSEKYLPPGDNPRPLLEPVFDSLQETDILFCNLEGPFSDSAKLAKNCRDTTRCYAFRVPERYVSVFDEAGFNLVSLANNHIGDFGLEGRNRTCEIFDSLGIYYAGPVDFPYSVFDMDSVTYGFCAFSPNKGTMSITDIAGAKKLVSMLDDTCDIVIVSFHGGAEGSEYQNVTRETEVFYGENRGNIYEFAHAVIDSGADVVLGHGPHVTRAIEVYKERFIAYSLGNFFTYRRFNLSGPNGFSPIIKIKTNTFGKFVEADIIPVYQDNSGRVLPDDKNRAVKKIQELVRADFPDSEIVVDDNGKVTYKH